MTKHPSREKSAYGKCPNIVAVVRLSCGFHVLFVSFLTTQNMMPLFLQQLGFGHLGFYSLTVLYAFFFMSCGPVPPLLKQLSPRKVLPVAALTYAVYDVAAALVASGVLPKPFAAVALLVASASIGVGAAGLWCCQGVIMTHYAPRHLLNKYVAFFLVCWQLSTMIGPLLANVLLNRMTIAKVFLLLAGVSCVGALLLAGLPAPEKDGSTPPEQTIVKKPFVELAMEVRSRLVQPILLVRSDRRAFHIAMLSLMNGVGMNSVPSAVLPRIVQAGLDAGFNQELVRQHVAKSLIWMGIGSVLAALSFAPVADRLGRRIGMSFVCASLLITLFFCELETLRRRYIHPGIAYVDLAALSLGFANIACRGSLSSLISATYQANSVQVIVLMQLCVALGALVGFASLSWFSLRSSLLMSVGGYVLVSASATLHAPLFATARTDKVE